MSARDGGPAFPSQTDTFSHAHGTLAGVRGMSLRDYLAAKAMQGCIANPALMDVIDAASVGDASIYVSMARNAYAQADAMLAAREAKS